MLKYKVQENGDRFLIKIEEKPFEGVYAEIYDIRFEEENLTFEYRMDMNHADLKGNLEFEAKLSIIVGDMCKQGIYMLATQYQELTLQRYEALLCEQFKLHNIPKSENETFLETIGRKGYYVTDDRDRSLIVYIKNNKKYYFDSPFEMDEFFKVFSLENNGGLLLK